jgi:hypothetical protein
VTVRYPLCFTAEVRRKLPFQAASESQPHV